jgi:hypothetical protein
MAAPVPPKKFLKDSELYILLRSFLNLTYALCKQYCSWYDSEVKGMK